MQLDETRILSLWVYYKEHYREYNRYNFVVYLFTWSRKMSLKTMARVQYSWQEFQGCTEGHLLYLWYSSEGFFFATAFHTHLGCDFVTWSTGCCRTLKICFHFLSLWIWTLELETNSIFQPGLTCCC